MQKNILSISEESSVVGGGELSFIDVISGLVKNGSRLLVLVPASGEVETRLRSEGVETAVLEIPQMRPWHLINMLRSIFRGIALCKKHQAGLIYVNGTRSCLYGGLIGRIMGIPVVWHCRITEKAYYDQLLHRLCTCIVTNSRATADRFSGQPQKKVKVVYNGLDINWLTDSLISAPEEIPVGQINILMLARVSMEKRHDLTLEAFESIAIENEHVHLYCVGGVDLNDQDLRSSLIATSRKSPFAARIHWIDAVEDIRPWLKAATIMVLPSDYESFGRVLIEAMACGVPVLASQVGGVPEIITDGVDGLMFPAGDAEALTGAIRQVLTDDELKQRLINGGLKRANDFSLDAHVHSMSAVFNDLIVG